jgi:RsiW-degrading membrane proteinase PrsW (M82 family)
MILTLIGMDLEPRAFALGFAAAALPVPLYVALALWLDRFEPEPARTLFQTFAWGATFAVFLAYVANSVTEDLIGTVLGPDAGALLGSVITAPVVEELAKGFALFVLYRELRDEFDGVVDGVVYAAMVGLGFAMIENVQYYGAAFAEGADSPAAAFMLRGMMSPFAHPLFTSIYGMGLGYRRERHGQRGSWVGPVAGLAGAMGLHALWNLSASLEGWFLALYMMVMVPAFLGVLWMIVRSLRREGSIVRRHLASLVDEGVLTPHELECLCVVRRRLGSTARAWRQGGLRHWRARRELHRIASELAFHRWRVARGITLGDEADAARDAEYLRRFCELCGMGRELGAVPDRRAAPRTSPGAPG